MPIVKHEEMPPDITIMLLKIIRISPLLKSPTIAIKNNGEICDTCNCHVFHQYTLKLNGVDRDALHQHLLDNNIPCAIYYPVPLHSQKAYTDERYNEEDFKVTYKLIKSVISLPMHTELEEDQLKFITQTVLNFINK